ncbi:Sodium/calcium exchanger NCL2 (Na(+)/Ca(2+)-exchange protein NCL2) (OsEFCAX2) (Protein NCX-like 2) (OsNCL2) [Durusdinium trenchii]|uniref:Sodium/calcium exchanger NCL2 (Na(+)/Ca(2+)-exchange protein NCL2) (OsEFCAX2) (Protein NCX-like 2) (OsNCL2) n=1 Tax=Durusdinium trenchii TaxID=1381693 RepID=A0ABP0LHQ0_9DINO
MLTRWQMEPTAAGDELFEVNDSSDYSTMSQELAVSRTVDEADEDALSDASEVKVAKILEADEPIGCQHHHLDEESAADEPAQRMLCACDGPSCGRTSLLSDGGTCFGAFGISSSCSRAPEPAQLEPAAPSFATFEETDTQKEIVEETSVLKDQKSAEGAPVKPRKRPTRRGGKRARHRPCHAAEWASSVGSAETPSFGEPGSGEEAEGEEAEEGEDEKEELKEELRDASAPRSFEKKDLKRRSFYPLAARLRLAAGLKPKGLEESKTAFGSAKIFSNHIQPKADVSKDGSVLPGPKVPPVSTLPNPIEVIEEVEPEPASASDVSDLPKQEPAEELAAGHVAQSILESLGMLNAELQLVSALIQEATSSRLQLLPSAARGKAHEPHVALRHFWTDDALQFRSATTMIRACLRMAVQNLAGSSDGLLVQCLWKGESCDANVRSDGLAAQRQEQWCRGRALVGLGAELDCAGVGTKNLTEKRAAVLGGRVDFANGKCQYNAETKLSKALLASIVHFDRGYKPEIRANAKIMVFTAFTYLLIQIPALYVDNQKQHIGLKGILRENSQESVWALLGMILCFVEFCGYMYMQYAASLPEQQVPHSVSSAEMLKATSHEMHKHRGTLKAMTGAWEFGGKPKELMTMMTRYNYAGRKTSKTITIALNTLEGAACMNNTFCLGIFMALVYFQGLAWKFTAETLTILAVEFALAGIVLLKSNQRVADVLLSDFS